MTQMKEVVREMQRKQASQSYQLTQFEEKLRQRSKDAVTRKFDGPADAASRLVDKCEQAKKEHHTLQLHSQRREARWDTKLDQLGNQMNQFEQSLVTYQRKRLLKGSISFVFIILWPYLLYRFFFVAKYLATHRAVGKILSLLPKIVQYVSRLIAVKFNGS